MKLKKPIKIVLGALVLLTLPSMLFLGFLYYKNHQELPVGISGKAADNLATKMLIKLNYEAFASTNIIEWTFKNRRHYKWEKNNGTCDVLWKDYKIRLNLRDHSKSKAYVHGFNIESDMGKELIDEALEFYTKDVFWLIAPYQVFNEGVKRAVVTLHDDTEALLVTYKTNESYLWHFDESGKPKYFNMWGKRAPIDGVEATWLDWTPVKTGALLPTFHKVLFTGLELTDIDAE